jgi:hypothetical protein
MKKVKCYNPVNQKSHSGVVVSETTSFYKVYAEKVDASPDTAEFWLKEFCEET